MNKILIPTKCAECKSFWCSSFANSGLSGKEMDAWFSNKENLMFDGAEEIYGMEDTPCGIYCILLGKVKLHRKDGDEFNIGPGDMFGLQGLINARYLESAVALKETTVCFIPKAEFSQFYQSIIPSRSSESF